MSVHGRMPAAAILFCAVVSIGGCAAYQDMVGIPRAGFQQNGSYVVSEEEEGLACRQIIDRVGVLQQQITVLPAEVAREEQSTPRTVGSALGRMFGGEEALKASQKLQRAHAERDALQSLMLKKQCI